MHAHVDANTDTSICLFVEDDPCYSQIWIQTQNFWFLDPLHIFVGFCFI
mgnify:CR=1 FL=1